MSKAIELSRLTPLALFAGRCGILAWTAGSLWIAGLVLPGIAENIIAKAGEIPTPFALTVLAVKPLFYLAALPRLGVLLGTFVIASALPRNAHGSERVLACAQAGAMGAALNSLLIVLFAIGVVVCIAPTLGITTHGPPSSGELHRWMVEAHWPSLGRFYVITFAAFVAGGALLWGLEALLECGADRLLTRNNRKRRVSTAR